MSYISKPIFLVGAERSGTTLLRLMLNSHSQLSWCKEFEYAVDLISNEGKYPDIGLYSEWLSSHRIFQSSNFEINNSLKYPLLVNDFLLQKKIRDKKPLIGATVHRKFDLLLKIWPDAKFIHIVRDGRDVARSCIGMGWAGNVWTGTERWIETENLWSKMEKSLSKDRKIEVRYESLISQPKDTLQKLCSFIGITFEPEMLHYDRHTSYSSPNPALLNQWKRKLSDKEIQLIESRIGHMLTERNYHLSGLPLIEVDNVYRRKLKLQCWSSRVRFRLKQNGLPLFIADYLSRRLNITPWQKQIKLKINANIQSQLK